MVDFIGRVAMDPDDLDLLRGLLDGYQDYMEIGTLFGGTAIIAGESVTGAVHCIDPLDGYYGAGEPDPITGIVPDALIVLANWQFAGLDRNRLHIHRVHTPPLPFDIPDRVDVALIDGDHSAAGVLADWMLLKDRVNKYIIFHDIDKREIRAVYNKIVGYNSPWTDWVELWKTKTMGVVRRVNE